jgi:ABC-type multidrug transport system fused ATPase/permease subunit
LRPYWRHLAGILLLGLFAPPLALLIPLPLKIAVDNVISHHPLPRVLAAWLPDSVQRSDGALLAFAAALVVAAALLSQLRDFATGLLSAYTGEKLLRGFRAQLFRHLQRLSLAYHDHKGTADSTYRVQYDAASLQRIAVDGVAPFITSALTLVVILYMTTRINARLPPPPAPPVARGQADRKLRHVRRARSAGRRSRRESLRPGRARRRAFSGAVECRHARAHAYGTYRRRLRHSGGADHRDRDGRGALRRSARHQGECPDHRRADLRDGLAVFRNVSFAYEQNRPALRDVSFTIEPGACVGIAGATGAGKSTLVNLLTRFYDPSAGQIALDGVDLRDYKLADLRNQFAIVQQEPILFSTSIAENIAYARPSATGREILAAAQAANAHEFIARLPQGYQTPVGERGMCLSGGERQRVSIARAFLKDASVLILDEPTSSVDAKTEAAIVEAMERLMEGRTTFIIAHRPSTLKHCDQVLKLEQGRLVELQPARSALGHGPFALGGLVEELS